MECYEVTVELPGGDWVWTIIQRETFHDIIIEALKFAALKDGFVHHVERCSAFMVDWNPR